MRDYFRSVGQIASVLILGVATGWLVGLSVSPVVHLVVGSLVTLIGALVCALTGLQSAPGAQTNKPNSELGKATNWAEFVIQLLPVQLKPTTTPSTGEGMAASTPPSASTASGNSTTGGASTPQIPEPLAEPAALVSQQSSLAAVSGKEGLPKLPRVDPLPFGVLALGIIAGTAAGIYVRANDVLGIDPKYQVQRWAGPGVTAANARARLWNLHAFTVLHGVQGPGGEASEPKKDGDGQGGGSGAAGAVLPYTGGFLVSPDPSTKEALLKLPDDELRKAVERLYGDRMPRVLDTCKDNDCLRAIVEELL